MKKICLFLVALTAVAATAFAVVELDGDSNGGVDVDKGGTNATTAAAARTALGLEISTDVAAALGADDNYVTDAEKTNIGNLGSAAYTASTAYAPALGADDNYVTDAEKTVIGNTSGANTGDQDLSGLVVGPASATDDGIVLYDGTTGKLIKSSAAVGTAAYTASTAYAPALGADDNYVTDDEKAGLHFPTGIASGFEISINTDTEKIDISSGVGYLGNSSTPIEFAGATALVLTYRTSSIITYLAVEADSDIIQQTTPFTPTQRRTMLPIGAAIHSDLSVVNAINNLPDVAVHPHAQFNDFLDALRNFNASGNIFSANGANLNINKSAGEIFKRGSNFHTVSTNPHLITTAALTAPSNIRYRLRDGTEYTDTAVIDPDYYDLAGVRTAVPVNKWTIQRIYMFTSNLVRIQYGQSYYGSKAEAIQAIRSTSFVVESNLGTNGLLRAVLVVQEGTTDLSSTTYAEFLDAGKLGDLAAVASGSGTTTMQQAYDNGSEPEIVTTTTRGSLTLQRGSTADTDLVLESKNGAGTTTFSLDGNGLVTTSTFPVGPTAAPTTDYQLANKKYVDDTAYTNLTSFVDQTAWRVFYSNTDGDVTELALGADGTYLKSNGATSAPTFATPAGSGDVSKVGTPVDNQVAVWTGDGTAEGTTGLTYDGSALGITGNITLSGTVDGIDIATDVAANTSARHAAVTIASGTDALSLSTQELSAHANVEQLADLTLEVSSILGVDGSGNIQTYDSGELLPVGFDIYQSDGTITQGGVDGTNNESLTHDYETTPNTVGVSSATGVTTVDYGTIGVDANTLTVNGTDVVDDDDIGVTVQAYDADLTTYAGITPSANVQSLLGAADYAAARGLLDLEAGTDFYSTSAADTAFEGELNNSAGLLAALSDETGTGLAVFNNAPALTAPVITGAGSIKITGEVQATVNIITKAANYTLGTDESTEVGGSLIIATAAMTLTLPTAASGYSGCLVSGQGVTAIIQLQPATGDYLVVDGVRGTAATAYASSGAAGDKICFISANADDWYITTTSGTWSE